MQITVIPVYITFGPPKTELLPTPNNVYTCILDYLLHVQEIPCHLGSSYCPDEVLGTPSQLQEGVLARLHLQFYVYNDS